MLKPYKIICQLKSTPYLFLAIVFFSCSKSIEEPELITKDVYQVTTLNSAKSNGLKEGTLSQVDLSEVVSLAADSKGNIYLADGKSASIKKLSPDGKITSREIPGEYGPQTPSRINVSSDDELQALTVYQRESDLLYFAKGDEPIKVFPNPFPKKESIYASISCVTKKPNGNYLVAYEDKLFTLSNQKTYVDQKVSIAISGTQLQGNISFMSNDERLYYIPDGLWDEGDPFASLKYIGKDYTRVTIKAETIGTFNKIIKYNFGDGTIPKASIGSISIMCGDRLGNVYFLESHNSLDNLRLRKLSKDGVLTTLAGGILDDNIDGIGEKAGFKYVSGITVDAKGDIYISTQGDGIRKVSKVK